MSNFELDELFDQATAVSEDAPVANPFAHIKTQSAAMDDVLNQRLADVFSGALALDRKKALALRIDGRIIGTGEADFTKGNTFYTLNYKGKRFQLIDVPGIEGDEGKYSHMVREAVAKAHLVFYVNGTNKKPEKATAEKIRSYLRLGTQVCPLVNVRGNADAYEFEEDRQALESGALQQTVGVLESVLGAKAMQSGHCVQGLLAFSALAAAPGTERTTIHPSRDRDLVIQQRNYRKYFASPKAMYEFSQIKSVAQVLHGNLIGAAVGAAVGLLINLMNFLLSKEKRIRKAQAQVQDKIAEARANAADSLRDELKALLTPVRSQIEAKVLGQVNDIHASLIRPLHIIKQQMALMQRTKDQLEKMPHGTIHAI